MCGVRVRNHLTGEIQALHAPVVVNAAGIWGQHIAEYADLRIRMFPAKGSLLIMDHRINQHVINRCRKTFRRRYSGAWRYHFADWHHLFTY